MSIISRSTKQAMRRVIRDSKGPASIDFSSIEDPRSKRGLRHPFLSILKLLFFGMLSAFPALRDVVAFGQRRNFAVSYFALYLVLSRLKASPFRQLLHRQVHSLIRAKALEPEGFPCHVIAVDGKTIYYGKKKLNKFCQRTSDSHTGQLRWHLKVLRAVLTSSPIKPLIEQAPIPANSNEIGYFADYYKILKRVYGRNLLQNVIFSLDAGFTSLENANFLNKDDCGYVMGLKENQPSLLAEAKNIFQSLLVEAPEYVSEWEQYKGKERRIKLYRSDQLQGWPTDSGNWEHLRQVWLLITEQRYLKGRRRKGRRKKGARLLYTEPKKVESRYFATNILFNYLKPKQILALVRGHWGIENNVNWTTDVQWNEDDAPWCRKGEALLVQGLLRTMAYNMLQWIKTRHIRNKHMKRWGWRQWFDFIKDMLATFAWFHP